MYSKKRWAAFLSIVSNSALIILKLIAGIAVNSIAVISEALHSGIDLIASFMAYFSIKKASVPADSRHKYGHGKYENIAGVAEALLITFAAVLIVIKAVHEIQRGVTLETVDMAIGVMFISCIANWLVSGYLFRVAKETESVALEADGWHLRTDVYTSLGVFAGLVVVRLTGLKILDPILAIFVAVLIFTISIKITKESIGGLLDESLPDEEEKVIKEILSEHYKQFVEFHELRTRRAGSERHIDLHLILFGETPLENAHELCDHLESDILEKFPNSKILIHLEPCKTKTDCVQDCKNCKIIEKI